MTENLNRISTYARLRTGAWGVRVPQAVDLLEPGDTRELEVHKRSGAVNTEQVRCFWAGEELRDGTRVALCEIVPRANASPA